jgi:predicted nucleic acid-binding protein
VSAPGPGRDRHRSLRCPSDAQWGLLASRYRPVLEGRPAIISFLTVAELEYGARLVGWGPDRLRRLEREIARAEIVWPGPNMTQTYASLRAWCVRTGHGLGQKEHEADRWVAATAVWLRIPLVAHDAIFTNVKDLELLTRLGQ